MEELGKYTIWTVISIIIGMMGGFINSLMGDEGFLRPYTFKDKDDRSRYSFGSWREIILGGAAGMISGLIASTTNVPSIWTTILYSFLAGISGSTYLEKMVERNLNAVKQDYNKQLDIIEQTKLSFGGENDADANNQQK
ncbi:hypothetical protein [Bacillus sp. AFS017336]|uniref:hypothetical protein n=1 Tax=Bacillus sp. AFS017336 TaxID=2033489 RepID=UPI000BF02B80|nr:hypothetical protein [Bacillus sp. AFS017336]PEL14368.1 hypothetical protein CN601_00395 [Bacillus sp. AFS017336]